MTTASKSVYEQPPTNRSKRSKRIKITKRENCCIYDAAIAINKNFDVLGLVAMLNPSPRRRRPRRPMRLRKSSSMPSQSNSCPCLLPLSASTSTFSVSTSSTQEKRGSDGAARREKEQLNNSDWSELLAMTDSMHIRGLHQHRQGHRNRRGAISIVSAPHA